LQIGTEHFIKERINF